MTFFGFMKKVGCIDYIDWVQVRIVGVDCFQGRIIGCFEVNIVVVVAADVDNFQVNIDPGFQVNNSVVGAVDFLANTVDSCQV